MMKFMINNRTDTWKPNINWYDFMNYHIVHSHLLTYFVCLLTIKIGQWACKNFCSYHNMHSGSLKWWLFCYNCSKHLTGILFDDAYHSRSKYVLVKWFEANTPSCTVDFPIPITHDSKNISFPKHSNVLLFNPLVLKGSPFDE